MNEPLAVREAPASYQVMLGAQRVRPGYKQTEVGVIPEDWDVKTLRDLNFDISDGNYSSKYPKASDFRPIGVPFIRANNIRNMTVVDDDMRFISEEQHQELQKGHLKANDILITTRGEIGQLALVPELHIDSNINAQLVRINSGISGVDHRFLAYSIIAENAQKQLSTLETGSALKQLPVGRLILLSLALPSPAEQRAIAAALSDVDALLAKLDQLIAKKRDLKQAAMQQLLTGSTRLPGFGGAWEVKRLGDICGRVTTGKLDANAMVESGEYPFFTCAREHYFIDKYAFDADALLVSGNGANVGYVHHFTGKFNAYQRTYVLTDFNAEILYLRLFMDRNLQERLRTEVNAGNTPYITMDTLTDMSVAIPRTREEQTAIATILSDMDAEIAVLEARRDKTRDLKQAMMQELLTGRIRLV